MGGVMVVVPLAEPVPYQFKAHVPVVGAVAKGSVLEFVISKPVSRPPWLLRNEKSKVCGVVVDLGRVMIRASSE
jgi:hypothetical protein